MPEESKEVRLEATGEQRVTTVFHPRVLDMHTVTDQELTDIASGAQSIHIVFFGITFGGLLAVGITFITVPLTSPVQASFVAALIVLAVMSAYFGILAARDYRASKGRIDRIRKALPPGY